MKKKKMEIKKKNQKKKPEEGRFWLKVSVQSEAKEKEEKVTEGERRRRWREEEEKEQGARVEGRGGRIVFHLCVVDVLINSVRFSFWRPCGVLHADSSAARTPGAPKCK